jgi:hypothetical protein
VASPYFLASVRKIKKKNVLRRIFASQFVQSVRNWLKEKAFANGHGTANHADSNSLIGVVKLSKNCAAAVKLDAA